MGCVGHGLSRLTLLSRELCGFDLPLAEMATHMRLTDSGNDGVMDGSKPKQDIYAAEEQSDFRFDATTFGQLERQTLSYRSFLTFFLRESIFYGGFKWDY
jgi:hypothetical protein